MPLPGGTVTPSPTGADRYRPPTPPPPSTWVTQPTPQLGGGQQSGEPQPGDVDPTTGNRWSPGNGWLPPNFFSDLNPPGQGGGGPGGGSPGLPPAPGQLPPVPGMPGVPVQPSGFPGIEMPEQLIDYIPENLRGAFASMLSPFLSQFGYQGMGNIGRYGERSFGRPGGGGPTMFTPEMFNFFSDPAMRSWYQWLFGERGFSPRVPYPK